MMRTPEEETWWVAGLDPEIYLTWLESQLKAVHDKPIGSVAAVLEEIHMVMFARELRAREAA